MRFLSSLSRLTVLPALAIFMVGCGGDSNNNNGTAFQPPLVGIEFPPVLSATDGDSVTVHALATGLQSPLTDISISLNGTEDSSTDDVDDFFRFGFDVNALPNDANLLTVTANDANAAGSSIVQVTRGTSWMLERGLQFDSAGGRWLALDAARRALLVLDLDSGAKTVLSGVQDDGTLVGGSNDELRVAEDMVIDTINNRALVIDSELQAVVAINLSDGSRDIYFDNNEPTVANRFDKPLAIAIDAASETVYILDAGKREIQVIDLLTDSFSVLSSNLSAGVDYEVLLDLAYDEVRARLLVADDGQDAILAVDDATGARSIFSNDTTPNTDNIFSQIQNLAVYNDRLYVSDSGPAVIIEVELRPTDLGADPQVIAGSRTLLIDSLDDGEDRTLETGNPLRWPTALAIDSAEDHLLVVDNMLGNLVQIDIVDDAGGITGTFKGQRSYVTGGATPEQTGATPVAPLATSVFQLNRPMGVDTSVVGDQAHIVDGGRDLLLFISLPAGITSALVDFTTATVLGSAGEIAFTDAGVLAALDQSLLVGATAASYADVSATTSGAGNGALFSVNVDDSNTITAISVTTQGSGYAYGDTLTLAGSDLGGSGSATITLQNDVITFKQPQVLVNALSDTDAIERFVVIDSVLDQVVDISLAGERTVASASDALVPLADPIDAVLVGELLYVLDNTLDDIVVVDVSDAGGGSRSVLANSSGIVFDNPVAMVLDGAGENLLIAEESNHSLIQIALADGSRSVVNNYTAGVSALAGAQIVDMILDPRDEGDADDRLLVLDRGRAAVFPVDLATGTVGADLSSPTVPLPSPGIGAVNQFVSPRALMLDTRVNSLYVLDDALLSLYVIDLQPRDETNDSIDNPVVDGQRLVFYRGTALND